MLAVALTILEAETCSNCGTPAWWGHSTDNTIAFSVESSVCYGCAELERDRETKKTQKGTKGEVRYVMPHNIWGDAYPLPSRHDAYTAQDKKG